MSAKGSGVSQGGVLIVVFFEMWWIENGVTGVAVPTGKFVGMTS